MSNTTIQKELTGYVYKITHIESGQTYFGSRVANVGQGKSPEQDFWIRYFTSSTVITEMVEKFGKDAFITEILYRDADLDEVFWTEQDIIKENINDPLCLNQHYKDRSLGHKIWSTHGKEPANKGLPSPQRGIKVSPERLEKQTVNRKGKNLGQVPWNKDKTGVYLEETIEKFRAAASLKVGAKNPFYGKSHTEKTKKLLSDAQKKERTCPHCGKIGKGSAMIRWHFDNCKQK
jgi:hypothetical protein